jgi:hypothetical protein
MKNNLLKIVTFAVLAFGTELAIWGFISHNLLMMFIGGATTLVAILLAGKVSASKKKKLLKTFIMDDAGVYARTPEEAEARLQAEEVPAQ